MKRSNINPLALAIGLILTTAAVAQTMSKDDYQAVKERITADYKSDRTACSSYSGNANDICMAQAHGKEKVAIADLEASYKPTVKNHYEARVAKAEAEYAVAKERCNERAGNAKDVCVKEAQAAETAAKADATVQMKTAKANATANEQSVDARAKADSRAADARKDARADKLDAEYELAKEKCDAYAGAAKDSCVNQAKARFGRS
jgi:hypothetical protein